MAAADEEKVLLSGKAGAAAPPCALPALPWWRQMLISVYWLSFNIEVSATLILMIPMQVRSSGAGPHLGACG